MLAGMRTSWLLSALVVPTLLLQACQPQSPSSGPAPPSVAAPAEAQTDPPRNVLDISQPLTARGNEPFWALSIDGTKMVLKRPDHPDLTAEAPGAALGGGRAVWVAKAADGQQLTVTLYVSDCSDGMSDARYPMSAEVVLLNEVLHGCAAKTAELPRGG